MTKRLQPGFYAQSAVSAAHLASRGVTGAYNVLDGVFGLHPLFCNAPIDIDGLCADLGRRFHVSEVSLKPYPALRGTHRSIEAAILLASGEEIAAERIVAVNVFVPTDTHAALLGQPVAQGRTRSVAAQFSLPYLVATALTDKTVALGHFTPDRLADAGIPALGDRIRIRTCPARAGTVELHLSDGRVLSRQVAIPLGSPERPLSGDQRIRKFRDCVAFSGHAVEADKLIRLIDELELVQDIAALSQATIVPLGDCIGTDDLAPARLREG